MIITAAAALLGGYLVWSLRDDDVEVLDVFKFDMYLRRGFWVTLIIVLTLGVMLYRAPDLDWWRYALALGLTGVVWTAGHGPALRGPSQDVRPDRSDPIWRLVTGMARVGRPLGWRRWLSYMALRYAAPTALLAPLTGQSTMYLAAALICLSYWPVGLWIADYLKENVKFVGAGVAGGIFYLCLSFPL